MSKVLVEVTQEDIDNGYRNSCTGCPVASAAQRATGFDAFIGQDPQGNYYMELYNEQDWISAPIELSGEVQVFIQAFDRRKPVSPFSFEIELPEVTP